MSLGEAAKICRPRTPRPRSRYHADVRCLLYSKQEWFRALTCQVLLASVMCLVAYSWIGLHVLYEEVREACTPVRRSA